MTIITWLWDCGRPIILSLPYFSGIFTYITWGNYWFFDEINLTSVLVKFNKFSEIFDQKIFIMWIICSFNISLYNFSENIPFWPWTKNKNVALGLVTYVTLDFFETLIAENSHCIKFYILFFRTTINASYVYRSQNLRGNFPFR